MRNCVFTGSFYLQKIYHSDDLILHIFNGVYFDSAD